jgi:hypothetical protein
VRGGQLLGDEQIPADEGPHNQEEASDGETELLAETQRRHSGTNPTGYKSGARLVVVSSRH